MSAGLHLRRWGQGGRSALLAHCSLGHGGAWRGVGERLGDVFTMTAPDLPSHGNSPDWGPAEGDYHRVATDCLSALAGEGPVDLIGHSLGATLLLRLALERPAIVRSLTLIEPVLFAAASPPGALADAPFAQAMAEGDPERAARLFLDAWGAGPCWDDMGERQRRYAVGRMPVVTAVDAVLGQDGAGLLVPGRLESLSRPVLFVQGAESDGIIARIIKALSDRLPQAEVVEIAGAGHMVPLTHPDPVADALRAFAART